MAPDLTKGHMQLSVYQVGLMYAILKECRTIADSCRADRVLMSDIHTRLEESFTVSSEQRVWFHFYFVTYLLTGFQVEYSSHRWGDASRSQ